jgi:hypothetical protein
MILPGILSSQISGHLYSYSTDFYQIATATVDAAGASSITFSSIPSTYKHLQIRFIANNTSNTYQKIQFNSDTTGADYYGHNLYGTGSAAGGSALPGSSYSAIVMSGGGLGSGNYFGSGVIDILDYANTNKYKTVRALNGFDTNGGADGQFIELASGLWQSTSAINTIKIFGNGSNYNQYSKFALYGAN